MRRIAIIIMIFWTSLFGKAADPVDWANKARYALANQELLASGHDSLRIVMMGNSITEFWEETHPWFFTSNHLLCRGISGQVSSQMLARFRQDVLQLKPRIVVINCGTNDIAENNGPYDEDITMDNIKSMTELAKAHGIEVVLSSVLPCDRFVWNTSVKGVVYKISHLNKRIIDYAIAQRLHYIDYHSWMNAPDGSMIRDYTDDGVHPNAAGYDIMEKVLLEKLDSLSSN